MRSTQFLGCRVTAIGPNFSPTAPEALVLYVDYGYGLPGEEIDHHRRVGR